MIPVFYSAPAPTLEEQSLQTITVQPQGGQRKQDSLPGLDLEERLQALHHDIKTDIVNSIKALLTESKSTASHQLPLTEANYRHDLGKLVEQANETQIEMGNIKKQLSR